MKHYVWQFGLAVDQLFNVLLGGMADETLSARAWRCAQKRRWWALIFRPAIDALFFIVTLGGQKTHCRDAWESELLRRHLPVEYLRRDGLGKPPHCD